MRRLIFFLLLGMLLSPLWGQQSLSLGITTTYYHYPKGNSDLLTFGHGLALGYETQLLGRLGVSVGATFSTFKEKQSGKNYVCDTGWLGDLPGCPKSQASLDYFLQTPVKLSYRLSAAENNRGQFRISLGYLPSWLIGGGRYYTFDKFSARRTTYWGKAQDPYRGYFTGGFELRWPIVPNLDLGIAGSYNYSFDDNAWPRQYAQAEVSAIYRLSK